MPILINNFLMKGFVRHVLSVVFLDHICRMTTSHKNRRSMRRVVSIRISCMKLGILISPGVRRGLRELKQAVSSLMLDRTIQVTTKTHLKIPFENPQDPL